MTSAISDLGGRAFLLALARILPIVWLVPAFGGHRAPPAIRVLLACMVALLCLPVVLPALGGSGTAVASAPVGVFVAVLLREVMVGLAIAIAASTFFRAAELAGNLVGGLSGLAGGATAAAQIGELTLLLGVVAFLELGGLALMAEVVVRSYAVIAVDPKRVLSSWFAGPGGGASGLRGLAELALLATARVFELALLLAAPVVVASWLVMLAVGVLSRALPRWAAGAELWVPLRAWLGLALLLLGMGALEAGLDGGTGVWALAAAHSRALMEAALRLWRTG